MSARLLISNGHVIDVYSKVDKVADIVITDGRISELSSHVSQRDDSDVASTQTAGSRLSSSDDSSARRVFDATNCYVTAGLIDCHVHAFQYATPLGIDVDERCLSRGVTSVVDAGSTGSSTFMGLRKLIAERCKTRIFGLLHIAQHGLASAGCAGIFVGGECDSLNVVSSKACSESINNNRDMLVGVKVRLAASVANDGKNEREIYRRALEASQSSKAPLMVHHALSVVEHEEKDGNQGCPGSLKKGDIYTHCFHGHAPHILDPDSGTVRKVCWEAKNRGVIFDVGHGQGSFSWRVAEQCASEGFWPDTISSDLHMNSQDGPAYDLMCVMTKMLYLGMSVKEIVDAVTAKPATVIGKINEVGHLGIGMKADVTVFKVVDLDSPIPLEDSFGEIREITKTFKPVAVFMNGEQYPVITERPWPDAKCAEECRARWADKL